MVVVAHAAEQVGVSHRIRCDTPRLLAGRTSGPGAQGHPRRGHRRLLGSFVIAKVWQTATHRARLGQAARVDASLVVDECQNFLHLPRSFDEMLAEARGYRLSMVLAHQHFGQLPKELRETVSANARTKVWFTMSSRLMSRTSRS